VAIGDLTGDGSQDLAIANGGDNTVTVLLNNGNGTTFTPETIPVGNFPNSVAIGDLNGDGLNDIAVTNGADNTVTLLINQGGATSFTPTTMATGNDPVSVALGSLDNGGTDDIAVANRTDNTVTVFLANDSSGDSYTSSTFPTDAAPESVAIGDLNGDGRPDIAVADAFSTDPTGVGSLVTLLTNTTAPIARTTSTSLNCAQTTLEDGESTTCTATVTDTASGDGSTPQGIVTFTGNKHDSFVPNPCTLSGSGLSASCQVTFTPGGAPGTDNITAHYKAPSKNADHAASKGTLAITVTSGGTE
jgi:hypothetical protein